MARKDVSEQVAELRLAGLSWDKIASHVGVADAEAAKALAVPKAAVGGGVSRMIPRRPSSSSLTGSTGCTPPCGPRR